jgi:hypothetical protein
MKPRERILTALAHEPPDRCPAQIRFTPKFTAPFKKALGL